MSNAGWDVRRLGGDPGLDDVFPHWTADGKSLLFETFAGPDNRPSADVWAIDSDGTDRRRVVSTPAGRASPTRARGAEHRQAHRLHSSRCACSRVPVVLVALQRTARQRVETGGCARSVAVVNAASDVGPL